MDLKTLFGLTVIPAGFVVGILTACLIKPIRDFYFVALIALAPLVDWHLDLNYSSRDWYRGTSRGFEISLLDIFAVSILISTLLAPRPGQSRRFWPASFGLMLLMFGYAAFNVAISDPRLFGMFELLRMFRGLILVLAVALFVRSDRELRLFILGMAILVLFESLLAVKQRYLEGLHRVPGTVIESNSLSVLLCTTVPVMVAAVGSKIPTPLKLLCVAAIPCAAVAEILTISRAGVIIMSLVLFGTMIAIVPYRINARNIALALVVVLGAGGLAAKSWKTLQARFHESTMEQEYGNKKNLGRGYYIRIAKAIAAEQFFGVGLNNWSYWVSNKYGPKLGYRFVPYKGTDHMPSDKVPETSNVDMAQAAPAHSLGALTLGELGIPGFILFILIWLRWFQMGFGFVIHRSSEAMQRMGVGLFFGFVGMFLQCLTEWVFRHHPLYIVIHCMLGVLMALYFAKKQKALEMAKQAAPAAVPVPDAQAQFGKPAFQPA